MQIRLHNITRIYNDVEFLYVNLIIPKIFYLKIKEKWQNMQIFDTETANIESFLACSMLAFLY